MCDDYGTLCGCDLHATFLLFSQINPLFCLNIRSNGSRAVHIRIRMDGIAIPSSNVSHISKRFHRSIFVYARPSILRTTKYGCTTWSRQNDWILHLEWLFCLECLGAFLRLAIPLGMTLNNDACWWWRYMHILLEFNVSPLNRLWMHFENLCIRSGRRAIFWRMWWVYLRNTRSQTM